MTGDNSDIQQENYNKKDNISRYLYSVSKENNT